jgi:phospholipid/cholesterol/gamma-HCH transport system substrate-binding protein
MSPRAQNITVGAFVLGALAVLVFGVYFLKETMPGRATDTYFARFDQVSTLQTGDPVKVNGVKAGRVASIDLEGRVVRVGFEVDRGISLPKDSEVRIQNIGLMGERQLGIRMGVSPGSAAPGDTFSGHLDAGIAEAMGAAGEAIAEADLLVRSLRRAVDSTVGRPEFASRINALLTTAEGIATRLDRLAGDVDPQVRDGVRSFRAVTRQTETFVRTQEPRLDKLVLDGAEAAARTRALAERGERAAQNLEEILAKLNAGQGTAGALLNDSTLHRDLSRALLSADSLFRMMRKKGLDVNVDLF